MTPAKFLAEWIRDHINASTKQTDAGKLTEKLVSDAAAEGIDRAALEDLVGRGLDVHVSDTIWAAEEAQAAKHLSSNGPG